MSFPDHLVGVAVAAIHESGSGTKRAQQLLSSISAVRQDAGSSLFGSKRSESRNSLSRRFSCVRLARHPKPIFTRLAAFEDRARKCHPASYIIIFITEPNPTEAQRNRRFFNSLPFAWTRIDGPAKSLEHGLP